jgi:hypothetical protein
MYGKLRRNKKTVFDTPRWTYFDVLTTMNRRKLHKLTLKLSQSPAGSARYLGCYGRARRQFERNLSEDLRQKYKAMAKEWGKKKLPRKIQQRYVHGNDSSRL